jgi:hypothetical protein
MSADRPWVCADGIINVTILYTACLSPDMPRLPHFSLPFFRHRMAPQFGHSGGANFGYLAIAENAVDEQRNNSALCGGLPNRRDRPWL